MGTLRKQRQDGAPRTCKSGWERRQLWIRMWTRAAWSEGCLCGLTLTVSAASLCLFVMFSPHPISAYPHCPTNNVFFFFFPADFISCPFTTKLKTLAPSLTAGNLTALWKLIVEYPFLFTSLSSIIPPHRAALLLPSLYRHVCFQALFRTYLQVN